MIRRPSASMLICFIAIYRIVAARIPRSRQCLYSISCSRHVEGIARDSGYRPAWRAMRIRLAACRPGYAFHFETNTWFALCVDGSMIPETEASEVVRKEAAICRRFVPRHIL